MENIAHLQLILTKGIGHKKFEKLTAEAPIVGQLPTIGGELTTEELVTVGQVGRLPSEIERSRIDAESLARDLDHHNVQLIVKGTPEYPERLTRRLDKDAPAWLFIRGNMSVLDHPSVSIAGSRQASNKGLQLAHDCAKLLVEHGVNVTSGYAAGVDTVAHHAALETGGSTSFVLAEGILKYRSKEQISGWLDDENHLVISEFKPQARWSVSQAMQRNLTILGLSEAMIIIEAGRTGGTFSAGEAALSKGLPLFVVEYLDPAPSAEGNADLLKKGARPLRKGRNGLPNLQEVLEAVKRQNKDGLHTHQENLSQTTG